MSTKFKLIDAVKAGDQAECTRLLEQKDNAIDIDIHERDENNCSAIIYASVKGHVNVVELLLSKGADINDKANDGCSSIIEASAEGHVSVVEFLLSKGANFHDVANDGSTAISLSNSDKIKYILRKWPISMAILILKELSLYCAVIDNDFLIDLYQYMGREDCTADNEEDYNMD